MCRYASREKADDWCVYMRIFLILLFVIGCEGGKFGSQLDKEKIKVTTEPQTRECHSSCASCAAWSWSEWSPATDTVCTSRSLTQQREGSRTCNNLCAGVECLLAVKKEREQQGTKTCTAPPPACETSCMAACTDWQVTTDWSPKPSTVCKADSPLTQSRTLKRTCTNLCPTTNCLLEKPDTQDVQGTKKTPCDDYCSDWGDWDKEWSDPKTICIGTTIEEKRTRSRTCTGLCSGTNCELEDPELKTVTGTKETTCDVGCSWGNWRVVAGQQTANQVCDDETFDQKQERRRTCDKSTYPCVDKTTCETTGTRTVQNIQGTKKCVKEPVKEDTCEDACQAWDTWSETQSCVDTASFTQLGSYTMTRSRTCDTTSLKVGLKCPTENSETLACDYCKGEGQKLASNGVCECNHILGYYKASPNAKSCTKCEAPTKVMKEVNGSWTCVDYECDCEGQDSDGNDICSAWSTWALTSDSEQASEVCKDEEFSQTLEQTRTCNAAAVCLKGKTCKLKETEPVSPMPVGTKETNCDTDCGAWGDWLPASAPAVCTGKFTQTRTRDCSQACSSANCQARKTQQVDCPPQPQPETRPEPPPPCDCDKKYTWTPNSDALQPKDICLGVEFNQAQTGKRTFSEAVCATQCGTSSTREVPLEGTKETPCADNCGTWKPWSDWSPALSSSCADTSATSFVLEKTIDQSRSRSRVCSDLCPGSKCPIANSEEIQTNCPYCQGEGQLLQDDGTCPCDTDNKYYRAKSQANAGSGTTVQTGCTKCESPHVLTYDGDDKTWECRPPPPEPPVVTNSCPKKYYHSSAADTQGNCLCDGDRNFIFGWPEGQLTDRQGQCVCDNHHYEVPQGFTDKYYERSGQISSSTPKDENTSCRLCPDGRNLRKLSDSGWRMGCVECGLEDLLRNKSLGHPSMVGVGKGGTASECFCAVDEDTSKKSVAATINLSSLLGGHTSTVTKAQYTSLDFSNWYNTLWHWWDANKSKLTGQPYDASERSESHIIGTTDYKYWVSIMFSDYVRWYREVRKYNKVKSSADRIPYPPIPDSWKRHYSTKRSSMTGKLNSPTALANDSGLRFITCTVADMIK